MGQKRYSAIPPSSRPRIISPVDLDSQPGMVQNAVQSRQIEKIKMADDAKTSTTGLQRGKIKRRIDLFMVLTWVASAISVLTLLWILESIITPAWPAIQKTGVSFLT